MRVVSCHWFRRFLVFGPWNDYQGRPGHIYIYVEKGVAEKEVSRKPKLDPTPPDSWPMIDLIS